MRLSFVLACCIAASACTEPAKEAQPSGRRVYDASPIDVSAFGTDVGVTSRVVFMPFGAAATRLGSLAFVGRSHFIFSRGGEEYEQSEQARVEQDAKGNFHVRKDNGVSEVEFFLIDENVYVRQDKGSLRKKPRRDARTDNWTDLAWATQQDALTLFSPRLRFVSPERDNVGGRPAMRYALQLAPKGEQGVGLDPALSVDVGLPVPPPARWREIKEPLSVSGSVWVDEQTGVIVKLKLEGRLEVPDRDVRPTQLLVRVEGDVKEIGKVGAITPPASIDEYMRTPPPLDPLSFFRSELPKEELPEEGKKTNGK